MKNNPGNVNNAIAIVLIQYQIFAPLMLLAAISYVV